MGAVNIFLAVFNMLPGYPLDGGRVVRSLVWRTTGSRHRATRAAARLGQGLGLALIVFGAAGMLFNLGGFGDGFSGIWLIFIGILLATQAAQGVRAAELERDLESLSVSDMMLAPPQARTVEADLPVRTLVPARPQLDHRDLFIVGEQGVAVGIASASAILLLDEERYQSVRMRDVMTRADQIQPIGPGASGDEALRRFAAGARLRAAGGGSGAAVGRGRAGPDCGCTARRGAGVAGRMKRPAPARRLTAVWAGKATRRAVRLLGSGGTALPGLVAERVQPGAARGLARDLDAARPGHIRHQRQDHHVDHAGADFAPRRARRRPQPRRLQSGARRAGGADRRQRRQWTLAPAPDRRAGVG